MFWFPHPSVFCLHFSKIIVLSHSLDSLLASTQTITINAQLIEIRRLINPSKRKVISNICPSISNQAILNALKNINITPVSHIVHLKANINIEGYDHVLSFCRQLFIKHDGVQKLPGSLLLFYNLIEFRVFFTDGRITCFLYNSTGHTSNTCKKTDLNPPTITKHMPLNSLVEPLLSPHIFIDSSEKDMNSYTPISPNHSFVIPQVMEGTTGNHQSNENPQSTLSNPTHTTNDHHIPLNEPAQITLHTDLK